MTRDTNRSIPGSRPAALLALLVCLTSLPGCVFYIGSDGDWHHSSSSSSKAKHHETRTFDIAHVPGTPIQVRTKMGSVNVRRGDVDAVHIEASLRCTSEKRLARTEIVAERGAGGELRVHVEWPDGKRKKSEGCSFEITVPDADGVHVESSFGPVAVYGLSGRATLDTSYGSVRVERHDGPVDADTSFGGIELFDVTGRVDARTSYGGVIVSLTDDNCGPVSIDTSFGGVEFHAGRAFRGTLDMRTSFGDVDISGSGGAGVPIRYLSKKKTSARVCIGEDRQHSSSIGTSYGAIQVRLAD